MNTSLAQLSKLVNSACPSRLVNAWCMKLRGECFLVTPAHVAVLAKDGKYSKSKYLSELGEHQWRVPRLYSPSASYMYDCAWAKVPNEMAALEGWTGVIDCSVESHIFFRQPYDKDAICDPSTSMLGSMVGHLYPTPKYPLLEVMDVGYRGLSGALAIANVENKNQVVGMLLRRGKALTLKRNKEREAGAPSPKSQDLIALNPIDETASHSDRATGALEDTTDTDSTPIDETASHSDRATGALEDTTDTDSTVKLLLNRFDSIDRKFDRMDQKFERMVERMDQRFERMDQRFDRMDQKLELLRHQVLKREDLDMLLNVTSMRRSIVMPCSRILELMEDSISLDELEGKRYEEDE